MDISSTLRIALNGMQATSKGLRTTAHNIANVATPGFTASRVEFTEGKASAVQTSIRETGPVDLTEQLLQMIEYARNFEAQAATIRRIL